MKISIVSGGKNWEKEAARRKGPLLCKGFCAKASRGWVVGKVRV